MNDSHTTELQSVRGLQQALSYIRHCRTLRNECMAWPTSLVEAVESATVEGFRFSASDLRQAFTLDYRMRLEVFRKHPG